MAERGFDYEGGLCRLCGEPLGRLRDTMRVPIFDPFSQGHQELAEYFQVAVHQECWDLWDQTDTLARLALEAKAHEYARGLTLVQGEFSGAWGYMREEVDFSHGALCFARSSMVYMDFGPYVKACVIAGRTVNIAAIVDIIESGQLVPGFETIIPAKDGVPELHLQCHDYENDRLEVEFHGEHNEDLDLTCFIRLDDLQDMRDSLKVQTAMESQPV